MRRMDQLCCVTLRTQDGCLTVDIPDFSMPIHEWVRSELRLSEAYDEVTILLGDEPIETGTSFRDIGVEEGAELRVVSRMRGFEVEVSSAGFTKGNHAKIKVNGSELPPVVHSSNSATQCGLQHKGRGLHCRVFDEHGQQLDARAYDTHGCPADVTDFGKWIDQLCSHSEKEPASQRVVLIAVKGSGGGGPGNDDLGVRLCNAKMELTGLQAMQRLGGSGKPFGLQQAFALCAWIGKHRAVTEVWGEANGQGSSACRLALHTGLLLEEAIDRPRTLVGPAPLC